jgi:outer membrane protein insertion porin family
MAGAIQVRFLARAAFLLSFVSSAALAASGFPDVEIDRIEVSGVSVFQDADVQGALEIQPGDRLERVKIIRTEENLQALYRLHGYEQVGIRSQLTRRPAEGGPEAVLTFSITEGKPTRVANVRFVPESIRDESFRRYWRSLESSLSEKSGLISGDVFDQEMVSEGKRRLQELLASEEFVGARVDDVRVSTVPAPQGAEKGIAGRWVSVEYHVDLGDRVSFGFIGNSVLQPSRLDALVEEQRVLGFGKDYIADIRTRIEDEYRSLGYASARATPFTFERPAAQERHVTFRIYEGPRVALESVDFDGNSVFTNAELREQFRLHGSDLIQHGWYSEKDAQKAAELTIEWMKSKGYLAAKLVTINSSYGNRVRGRPAGSYVRLIVYVYEGEQTIVQDVRITGNAGMPRDEILGVLGVKEGRPLNLFAFSEGIETLKATYRGRGYLGVKVVNEGADNVVRYSDENRQADITIALAEGPRYRVTRIQTEGLTMTKEIVVRRELLFHEGDILEEPLLSRTEANLRKLGIFAALTVRAIDDPEVPDGKIVRISAQEGTPGFAEWGFGFRNDFGPRAFGSLGWTNIGGENHTVSASLSVNHRLEDFRFWEFQAQLGYLWPWFLGDKTTFRPTLNWSKQEYIEFDAETISLDLTWERKLVAHPAITAAFLYSLEEVHQSNAVFPQDDGDFRIGAITPSLRLDTRDDPLSPTTGWFANVSLEIADPLLLSQSRVTDANGNVTVPPIGYYRFQARLDRHFALAPGVTLFVSGRVGFERNDEPVPVDASGNPIAPVPQIPLIKQFALGGVGSLRGYDEQELNYQSRGISGILTYVNYRTQLDFPFAGALRLGPFLDAANLQVDTFSFGNLVYGAGMGFHYQTPVGPVNLDWGFKVPQTNQYRFYFSIGVI